MGMLASIESRSLRTLFIYAKRLLVLLLIILIGPILLVVLPPFGLTFQYCEHFWSRRDRSRNMIFDILFFLFIPVVFAFGLASVAIIAPIGIVIFVPFVVINEIISKIRMHRDARNKLKERMQQALEIQRELELE
jgi:hypothetical protein